MSALGGKLYVFGGEAPGKTFADADEYDPVRDAWTARTPMTSGRQGPGAAASGGVIYLIGGGKRPGLSVSSINESFTIQHNNASLP